MPPSFNAQMSESSAILDLWRNRQDGSGVLVTLVRVEGSSYRRPGARMYIQAGRYAGSISGGCLETEIVRKAQWVTRAGAAIETYSTRFENPFDAANPSTGSSVYVEDQDIPYGLGCGGVLDVLLEPAALPEADAMLRAMDAAQTGERFSSATQLPSAEQPIGTFARVILRENGSIFFASENADPAVSARLIRLASQASGSMTEESSGVFVESILPPQRLVIFGAGEDARPLVRMAHLLGWRVAVADGRAWLAQAARFPEATQVLALSDNAVNLEQLQLTSQDAVAVLTHSFEQDRNLLRRLLPLELRYLGLLGARHRSQLLLTEAAQQLGWTPEECLQRVYAPIGLDLGGDNPEAVALAIISEIQSVLHGKEASSRRMDKDALSAAPERPYIPSQCPLDIPHEFS